MIKNGVLFLYKVCVKKKKEIKKVKKKLKFFSS
jgi:hypothetical protein